MGKKMMKSYKIFILFFLMSMSVFAKKPVEETFKINDINLGEYSKIILTVSGEEKIDAIYDFSEINVNSSNLINENEKPSNLIWESEKIITYKSNLDVSPGDTIKISFIGIDYDDKGREGKDKLTYVSKEYVVPGTIVRDDISVASVDVTGYYVNQEIKIILEGNSGNKTISNNGIKETSESGTTGTATPTGNSITEITYITPIELDVEPGDIVTVEFVLSEGETTYPLETTYIVPSDPTIPQITGGIRTEVEEVNSDNYNEIKIKLVSITTNDVESMELTNVNETREGQTDNKSYSEITMSKIILSKVEINGITYYLDSNNLTIEIVPEQNDKRQYVYGWEGTYTTEFTEEEGKERTISFTAARTMLANGNVNNVKNLSGNYTEPIETVETSSNQWIYSQITKENLVDSEKYEIDFYENIDTIKTIDEDGSLEELLESEDGYSGTDIFKQKELERYSYLGTPKSVVEFKITKNAGEPQNGKFELTIEENSVFKRKINESYTIPVPINDLEEQDLESSKNTFIYEDEYELENLKAYKYQEVVFRIYTGSKHDEVRPIKKIEENELSDTSYVDFVFENDASIQTIEKDGITGKFIEGKFELMGLKDGISYKLDFYTLRYRDNDEAGNYVAVTYEKSLSFIGKNISSTENTVWLEDIDISKYKTIKLNMITVTPENLIEISLENLTEVRKTVTDNILEDSFTLQQIPMIGEIINIGENSYTVNEENQIILDENNKKYIYRWEAEYETSFDDKDGIEREVSFDVLGVNTEKVTLTGKYIEPTPAEIDTGASHQWVMFVDSEREFENKNYQIEDRVLSPEREGYKRLKTIDYRIELEEDLYEASDLEDYLYGVAEHSTIKEFVYENEMWNYPQQTTSGGIIIEKTITESKGTLKDEDGFELLFYTDNTGDGIEKTDESADKATFRWNEGPLNTNGEILSYDKVIFRITKEETNLDDSFWNPYDNTNPINLIEPTVEGNKKLGAVLYGNVNDETYNETYVDVVLDASTSKTMTFNSAIISYEQTSKELRIVGLPVGDYTIQFYSVKRGHDDGYKVITYENEIGFGMDVSDIVSLDFEQEKNIHKIDFITVGEDNGDIEVNVNFITKMEREINLTVDNLESNIGSDKFKIKEKNEGTGETIGIGEAKIISLEESGLKKYLYPLDVVFVIDNSGSMQNEIDAVKDGLSAFGQELLDRGFDVKYNLITFGPEQNEFYYDYYKNEKYLYPTGNWRGKVTEYDRGYMAIYKEGENNKWFNGSKLDKTSSRENDLEELIDAFENINALWGYDKGQENSAWGIHYAIEKLRTNGRYLSYSGEIVENSSEGYMPSEKMIIFLTDENMDTDNLPSELVKDGEDEVLQKYDKDEVLQELYTKLNGTYNGMPDNIDLNGIFHIRKRGNTAPGAENTVTTYDEVPDLKYKYSTGKQRTDSGGYWEEWDDNETAILGIDPSDTEEVNHTDFKLYNTANNFFMYEMGSEGEGVKPALDRSIDNLGIIQRWDLSYLTPFNEYDGTIRTIDFELTNVMGTDDVKISGDITNLNEEDDKQYTVKEEKLALEFTDPSDDNLKLSIVDGKGTITFRGKARYNEFDENNNPVVVEDMINEYKLDVLDSSNKLLFSRNTDNIEMSLSDEGWLNSKVTKAGISSVLKGREKLWVEIINNSEKEILDYIDKARYLIDENQNYEVELTNSQKNEIKGKNVTKSDTTLALTVDKTEINIEESVFKTIISDRYDTWYELKNTSENTDLFNEFLTNDDFEELTDDEYRIKLKDLELVNLIDETVGDTQGIEIKISKTKIEELSGIENLEDTFDTQGWYDFKIELTDDEMDILINSETIESIGTINLEATIVTDLFNKTEILKDVEVDLSVPLVTNINLENKTLFDFLDTMYSLDKTKTFENLGNLENFQKYWGYDVDIESGDTIPDDSSYGKNGDEIYLELTVEGKNIDKDDIVNGIGINGWSNPVVVPDSDNENNEIKKFIVTWDIGTISDNSFSDIIVKNNIKNEYGLTASQDITVLNIDNSNINIDPKISGIIPIKTSTEEDEYIYYVNSDYKIDLGNIDDNFRAGVIVLDYDNEKADEKENEREDKEWYGNPEDYYEIGDETETIKTYGGGIESSLIPVEVDETGSHVTDGEYKIAIDGMSRSGKLNGITTYNKSVNNETVTYTFKEILSEDISEFKNLIVRVDTIAPKIIDISKQESTESLSHDNENYYYFDLSFDIEDFNASYEKLNIDVNGNTGSSIGYNLVVNDVTKIITDSTYGDEDLIEYTIKVKKSSLENGGVVKITIVAVDKAGNKTEKEVVISIPKDIKVNTYEELHQAKEFQLIKDGYKFTKGGLGSNIPNPGIYVTIPSSNSEDEKIGKLKIQKIGEDGSIEGEKIITVSSGDEEKEIEVTFDFGEGVNTVKITPISIKGIKGNTKKFKFVVDTRVNTSYLDNEIIGSVNGENILIDLSKIEELSGVEGYEYIFTVEGKKTKKVIERGLGGKSFVIPKVGSISGIETIDISKFIGGSKGILSFTVYDKLGNKKTFEKTYFIPTKPSGIIAKVSGETKQRRSRVTILAEGSGGKFGIDSSVDRSSEDKD